MSVMDSALRKLKKSLSVKLSFKSTSDNDHSPSSSRSSSSPTTPSSAPARSSGSRISRTFSFKSSKKTCAICLGSLRAGQGQAIFTAECSHPFHFNCIATNVKHGNRICPVCRCEWKDIPFEAPIVVAASHADLVLNNIGRSQISPYNLLAQGPPVEPASFSDDEPLPVISESSNSINHQQAVTIKTFSEFNAVSALEAIPQFAVLLRLLAAPIREGNNSLDRAPIDLVTVLDVSGSMDSKLPLLKRAVNFIIENLGNSDRLSIVSFSTSANRILPLRRMTENGRADAILAVSSLYSRGGTNIVEGLKKGVRVLEERRQCNPIASIILLSDGQDTQNSDIYDPSLVQNQPCKNPRKKPDYMELLPASICPCNNHATQDESQRPIIPVHTFGFGFKHDSTAMHAISDASGGTFSFIESVGVLQDAFARCIGGLLSVVAQDVRLSITSISPGVQIGSIPSGRYVSEILEQGKRAFIDVGNLYADEEKEFLVYLSIPTFSKGDKQSEDMPLNMPLLDVGCAYKDSVTLEMIEVEGERVELRRPTTLSSEDKKVCLEVDRQRNRLLVADIISDARQLAETGDLTSAQALLRDQRTNLSTSVSAQAGDALCYSLDVDLKELSGRMESRELYEQTGRAYLLSGLSSHSWQRATTRGSPTVVPGKEGDSASSSGIFETPSMVNMVSRSQIYSQPSRPQEKRVNKSGS